MGLRARSGVLGHGPLRGGGEPGSHVFVRDRRGTPARGTGGRSQWPRQWSAPKVGRATGGSLAAVVLAEWSASRSEPVVNPRGGLASRKGRLECRPVIEPANGDCALNDLSAPEAPSQELRRRRPPRDLPPHLPQHAKQPEFFPLDKPAAGTRQSYCASSVIQSDWYTEANAVSTESVVRRAHLPSAHGAGEAQHRNRGASPRRTAARHPSAR